MFVFTDSATVADLVGLTFWKYLETTKDPVSLVCMSVYAGLHTGGGKGGMSPHLPPPPPRDVSIIIILCNSTYYNVHVITMELEIVA